MFRQHGYTSEAEQILIAHPGMPGRSPGPARGGRDMRLTTSTRPSATSTRHRVLWLLAALLVLFTATLELPAGQATLRATNGNGDVYATSGLLATSAGPLTSCPAARGSLPHADSLRQRRGALLQPGAVRHRHRDPAHRT